MIDRGDEYRRAIKYLYVHGLISETTPGRFDFCINEMSVSEHGLTTFRIARSKPGGTEFNIYAEDVN